MRKFGPYPIYINHPGQAWEAAWKQERDTAVDRGDWKRMQWLDYYGRLRAEIAEDKERSWESRNYEHQVHGLLQLIGSTKIGNLLFGKFNPGVKHWIVPMDRQRKIDRGCKPNGYCGATTFPAPPDGGGGERTYFNPTDFNWSAKKWRGADDVLFHELVHAYRGGRIGYSNSDFRRMNEYETAEEFIALHMQNVYLAQRGATRFYRSYDSLESVSKDSAYRYFAGDAEVLMAFRHFVDREPLAAAVAKWTQPADSFNPWRDQPVLERMYLGGTSGIQRLPPF